MPVENHPNPNIEFSASELPEAVETENSASLPSESKQKWHNFRGWPWLVGLTLSGLTGLGALFWLSRLPSLPNCSFNATAETGAARLYCTKQAVETGNLGVLVSALEMVGQWPQDDPLASQANYLANEWSRLALIIARQKMKTGDLQGAMRLARKIPASTAVYSEARAEVQTWEQDWQRGKNSVETAQEALQAQNWKLASAQIKRLAEIDSTYWRYQVEKLIEQIATEKQAAGTLRRAQNLAESGIAADLAAAIRRARQVEPDSYVHQQAEAEIEQWSQELLEIAQAALGQEDWDRAIAAATGIPPGSQAFSKAQDLVQLGEAQTQADQDHLGGYLHAWALAQQIQPKSALYQPAQGSVSAWETQIQNLGQIQLAKWLASLDQGFAYQLAINHAQMIKLDQPRRTEAQTLVAHWRNQIETLEDRHFLARARELALTDTIPKLKAAIAVARQIDLGRALRIDAQTLIAQWQGQIQRIQDQPILDRAQALARRGQLQAAIDKANQIAADRSLYPEAQAAINRWIADIQIAQDRPLLREARDLANQGRLSDAIALAAQIGYGRPLYYEAQDYISRWQSERAEIEAARATPEPVIPEPATEGLDGPLEEVEPFEPEVESEPQPPNPEPVLSPRPEVRSSSEPRNQEPAPGPRLQE